MGAAVSAIALATLIGASPVFAQSQGSDEAALATSVSPPDSTALTAAAVSPADKKTLGQKVKALVAKLTPDRIKRDVEFRKASALFPDFCKPLFGRCDIGLGLFHGRAGLLADSVEFCNFTL